MKPGDSETENAEAGRAHAIPARDEVFGLRLQVRGKPEEARRVADFFIGRGHRGTGRWRGDHGLEPVRREGPQVGRNDPCPCGSGKKFKKCRGG